MSKILITGAAGFIGSRTLQHCVERNHQVIGIDNLSSGYAENLSGFFLRDFANWLVDPKDRTLIITDVGSHGTPEIVKQFRPETIIHLAAQPSLLASMQDPCKDAFENILHTISMAELAREHNARFIFSSTSATYPDGKSHYIVDRHIENDMRDGPPSSPYGISKLAAEYYIQNLLDDWLIFRFANVYGPRQRPLGENQLIPRAIRHILHGDEFSIYGSGEQTRDFVYVKDVARILVDAAENKVCGIANLGSGKSTSVNDVLDAIKLETGWDGEWPHTEFKDDRMHVSMDISRLKSTFRKPGTSLRVGIRETVKWWKKEAGISAWPRTTQTYSGEGKAGGK